MAVLASTTSPGTEIKLRMNSLTTASGSIAFDISASAVGSDVWSKPRRYPDFEPIATVLAEILDPPDISELRQSVAKRGAAEINLWLLDEQASRLGIYVRRP